MRFLVNLWANLNTKFDSMSTHQKTMETQSAQQFRQVSHLSRPQVHLSSYLEMNSNGKMNAITLRNGEQLEEPKRPWAKEDEELVKHQGTEIAKEKEDSNP